MAFKKGDPTYNEKVKRNEELYQYKLDNPDVSYIELGRRFDITDARACQIFKRMGKEHISKEAQGELRSSKTT